MQWNIFYYRSLKDIVLVRPSTYIEKGKIKTICFFVYKQLQNIVEYNFF